METNFPHKRWNRLFNTFRTNVETGFLHRHKNNLSSSYIETGCRTQTWNEAFLQRIQDFRHKHKTWFSMRTWKHAFWQDIQARVSTRTWKQAFRYRHRNMISDRAWKQAFQRRHWNRLSNTNNKLYNDYFLLNLEERDC